MTFLDPSYVPLSHHHTRLPAPATLSTVFGTPSVPDKVIPIVYNGHTFQVAIPYFNGPAGLLLTIEKQLGDVSLSGCKIVDSNENVAELHSTNLRPDTTYYVKAAIMVPHNNIGPKVKDRRMRTILVCWSLGKPSQIFPDRSPCA